MVAVVVAALVAVVQGPLRKSMCSLGAIRLALDAAFGAFCRARRARANADWHPECAGPVQTSVNFLCCASAGPNERVVSVRTVRTYCT